MKDYNFFSIYSKGRKRGIDIHSPYVIGLLSVVIFAMLTAGFVTRNILVEKHIQALRAEVDTIKASSAFIEAEKLRINIQAMQNYDQNAQVVLEKFEEANVLGTSFLEQLAAAVPNGVSLNSITTNKSIIQITCTVPTRKAAAEFQLHLKELPLFQSVHMGSVVLKEDKSFIATIECMMRKVGEAQ